MKPKDGNLRALEREHLPTFHWVSIETAMTGAGVPDMNYCNGGCEGWIENKQCHGWKPKMRVEQIGWLMRRRRAGGRAFIAVRRQNESSGDDELYMFDGALALQLSQHGIQGTKFILRFGGGPARWHWAQVAALLVAPTRPSARAGA